MTPQQEKALRDALSLLPRGEWEVWTSCSLRRISRKRGGDGDVLHAYNQRDGHPDLSMDEKQLRALCSIRNTVAEILGEV
ncbi:MAG: hypothetical protein BVN33_14700 [Proteobacteria bacterium ST_bin13]|nr:MAG: hypothetical protein BVN33_14700 [Proteobacteria bacterium ST_bin13]